MWGKAAASHNRYLFIVVAVYYRTLENWDLSDVARLNLPHSIQKLYGSILDTRHPIPSG